MKMEAFDARGFLQAFEAEGGKVYSDGQSFAVIYPPADVGLLIPPEIVDWGAVIGAAHERAVYGPS